MWKMVVGELLMYGASEIPLLESSCDALCKLLDGDPRGSCDRGEFAPVRQVYYGTRDLRFGNGCYRPEHAGFNDVQDVQRLAAYLGQIDPGEWEPASLEGLPGCEDSEACIEELELVREWFPPLYAMYRSAGERQQIIVCESV
jgi:hypothetical protein